MADGGEDEGGEENGIALWRYVTRSVRPLVGRVPVGKRSGGPVLSASKTRGGAAAPPVPPAMIPRRGDGPRATDMDRRTDQKLKRGQMEVEARIDLHGMTRAQAQGALVDFIARTHGQGKRCVLVITGKGLAGAGALRQATPVWLREECGDRVLRFYPARPRDGGEGALYVLLRRDRDRD